MGVNSNITMLDPAQAVAHCIDPTQDSLRVHQLETDSIAMVPANTGVNTVVIDEQDASQFTMIQLYAKSTTAVGGTPPTLTVQLSPVDSGDVWFNSALTLQLSASINAVVMGTTLTNAVARRVRVRISAALDTAEAATAYLVMRN